MAPSGGLEEDARDTVTIPVMGRIAAGTPIEAAVDEDRAYEVLVAYDQENRLLMMDDTPPARREDEDTSEDAERLASLGVGSR